ncbi:MAG TPA: helicase [Gammaproteobacteria bacterium]|nr:helicase [Gammaproteobacteria bacterium]
MNTYSDFLNTKAVVNKPSGMVSVPTLNDKLFMFQRDITQWSLRLGRSAIFADCGLGKTFMQLEWAHRISGRVLILCPLAVAKQTVEEGGKFGIPVRYCRSQDDVGDGITTANYEMLDHFDVDQFTGIVLDESSILKAYDGKTRTRIIESFRETPYRLACTATPAPNDYMELGNHAEFLGVMTRGEMLSTFFVHDGGETQKWRLKGHAESDFWRWLCSWAVMLRHPSDLGYDDQGFDLPPWKMHQHVVNVEHSGDFLFPMEAQTLHERLAARRNSTEDRAKVCAELVNGSNEPWIIWCNLNSESEQVARMISDAVEVRGSNNTEHKEQSMQGFADGSIRVLVTKPSIAGFGMNWQHCSNVAFLGLSDSYEQFYQAIRRSWRFGQRHQVHVHVITAETEGAVVANIRRKEIDADRMAKEMVSHMHDLNEENIKGTSRTTAAHETAIETGENWTMHLGDCVDVSQCLDTDSIHYTIFSPPFSSLYTYSNSDRDMGNSRTHEEFSAHYQFLIDELFRVTMPGRLMSFHCMNLPTSKTHHGYIGLRDFRGELIKQCTDAGFIYHSEVVIWKDPVTAMQRTKALGLLHKQLKKDSAMSRQGIPDYLVTVRKPGENQEPITHTNESFPVSVWQRYASPIWTDIKATETLQYRSAREHKDERHIAPLQLEVVRRAVELWSNPGDLIFSPFAGIGSEGYIALQKSRQFLGAELKRSYWGQACRNLALARQDAGELFSTLPQENETSR